MIFRIHPRLIRLSRHHQRRIINRQAIFSIAAGGILPNSCRSPPCVKSKTHAVYQARVCVRAYAHPNSANPRGREEGITKA